MAKKKWCEWRLDFQQYQVWRMETGVVWFFRGKTCVVELTPTEARRLFQKLSADYR